MHADHRRRYHVRPAAEVYPGDRISTDQQAIDAVEAEQADAAVDWDLVEQQAHRVRDRRRIAQTTLKFITRGGDVTAGLDDRLLVVQERRDGTAS